MKNFLKLFLLVIFFGLMACKDKSSPAPVQPAPLPAPAEKSTVVYLVRHAEKGTNSATDPDLSTNGQLRAQALKDSLQNEPVAAIYTTTYKRTKQTAAPLAAAKNITPTEYDAIDVSGVAAKIKKDNQNQTVLVVGHSNTVLEIIEALGAQRPVSQLSEADYNYLFRVTLKEGKTPQAETLRYGL